MHEEIRAPIIESSILMSWHLQFADYMSTVKPTMSQMAALPLDSGEYRLMSLEHSTWFQDDQTHNNIQIYSLIYWISLFSNNDRVEREVLWRCLSYGGYDI